MIKGYATVSAKLLIGFVTPGAEVHKGFCPIFDGVINVLCGSLLSSIVVSARGYYVTAT
jgi:hypothetical protein